MEGLFFLSLNFAVFLKLLQFLPSKSPGHLSSLLKAQPEQNTAAKKSYCRTQGIGQGTAHVPCRDRLGGPLWSKAPAGSRILRLSGSAAPGSAALIY